jgi:hypothetical protein
MKNSKDVMVRLALLAEQSGEKVSETRLKFTSEKILSFGNADLVSAALEKLLESSRRFPTVDEIKKAMGFSEPTNKELGTHVANLLLQAMGKFGETSPGNLKHANAVRFAVGEQVFEIVTKMGGWNFCIERANENIPFFISQTRDLVEAYVAAKVIDKNQVPAALPSRADSFAAAEKISLEAGDKIPNVIKMLANRSQI